MFSKLSGKVRIYTFFLTVLVGGACQLQLQPNLQRQRSKQGMAVSAHPLASVPGKALLQQGGNAVDAPGRYGFGDFGGGAFFWRVSAAVFCCCWWGEVRTVQFWISGNDFSRPRGICTSTSKARCAKGQVWTRIWRRGFRGLSLDFNNGAAGVW